MFDKAESDKSDESDRSDRLAQCIQDCSEFAGRLRNVFFFKNAFVVAGTDFDFDPARGITTPQPIWLSNEQMSGWPRVRKRMTRPS